MFVFFFFQAEDGIRDVAVTGVQTCALPICVEAYPSHAPLSNNLAVLKELAGDLPTAEELVRDARKDRKSTRLNSSHGYISYAVFCLKKKKTTPSKTPICTLCSSSQLVVCFP